MSLRSRLFLGIARTEQYRNLAHLPGAQGQLASQRGARVVAGQRVSGQRGGVAQRGGIVERSVASEKLTAVGGE